MKKIIMKQGSTFFLKAVIIFLALVVLALCIFALPSIGRGIAAEFPAVQYLEYSILIIYATAIPFYIALYQAWKLLRCVDKNTAFSQTSVNALKCIKYCAISISGLYILGMPFIYLIAEADDAPGLILFGMVFACSPIVVAVFAAVLQKLLKNAISLKSENDLTV